jgi:hypothetical protein
MVGLNRQRHHFDSLDRISGVIDNPPNDYGAWIHFEFLAGEVLPRFQSNHRVRDCCARLQVACAFQGQRIDAGFHAGYGETACLVTDGAISPIGGVEAESIPSDEAHVDSAQRLPGGMIDHYAIDARRLRGEGCGQ